MTATTDRTQELMNEGYAWFKDSSVSSKEFYQHMLENMSQKHLDAVVAGNLNYQVCNGGFSQWVANGYAVSAWKPLKDLLTRMGTANSQSILNMLERIEDELDFDSSDNGFCGSYWNEEEPEDCFNCGGDGEIDDEEEGEWDEEAGEYEIKEVRICCPDCQGNCTLEQDDRHSADYTCDSMSDDFYEINEAWMQEVEDMINDLPLNKVEVEKKEESKSNAKYPHITVELTGSDGNAFAVMGKVKRALRTGGVSREEIDLYMKESMSSDYNNLLVTAMRWVEVE